MEGDLIFDNGQLEYRGYLFGDGEVTFMDAINGWEDLPSIDSANALRPGSHGAWVGKKIAGERIITWEGRFAPEAATWADELKSLRSALSIPVGTEEYPIVIRMHEETRLAYGTVVARAIPGDRQFGYYGAKLSFQLECSDPRRYSLTENSWSLTLAGAVHEGLSYPLNYPLYYGNNIDFSFGALLNNGDVITSPTFTFYGPMYKPILLNTTTGIRIGFNINLTSTDTLTVNTKTGTVLLNAAADRLYMRMSDSAPILSFGLVPGVNDLKLFASSWGSASSVEVVWRDATL